jgi:MerR family transcriptional regulator, light-induced transcriptional regulator
MSSRNSRLSDAVIGQVIPRLSTARLSHPQNDFHSEEYSIKSNICVSQRTIIERTDDCLSLREKTLEQDVIDLLEQDVAVVDLYENLLAPVARELGDRWLADQISFVDVHLGVLRLQSILNNVRSVLPIDYSGNPEIKAALSAAPGDQHTFGIAMACDLFSRRGWEVSNFSGLPQEEYVARLGSSQFDVIGLSLYVDSGFEPLCRLINTIRSMPKQAGSLIVVSGDYFVRNPEAWVDTGADTYSQNTEETERFVLKRLQRDATARMQLIHE